MRKTLTLSLVIPVFNEEDHLKACLDSIAAQTTKPHEVIVVDNNSTDKSIKIAKSYKFVKIISEKQQSQVFAQDTGFRYASGDILGRIDGDSILSKTWVEQVTESFRSDPELTALTGLVEPYDMALKTLSTRVFYFYQVTLNKFLNGHPVLSGANCAIRHSAWRKIEKKLTYKAGIWEDYDISYALAHRGHIAYKPDISILCSFAAVHGSIIQMLEYQYRGVRTYRLHFGRLRTALFFLARYTVLLLFPLIVFDSLARKFNKLIGVKAHH